MSSPIFAASTPHFFVVPSSPAQHQNTGVTVGHRAPRSCPPAAPGRPPRQRGRAACGRPRRRRRCRWSGPTAPDTDTGETGDAKKRSAWENVNCWKCLRWLKMTQGDFLLVVEVQNVLHLKKHVSTLVTGNKNIIKECWEMTDQQ
jgi:hypothetical protein